MRTLFFFLVLFILVACIPVTPTATLMPKVTATSRSGSGTPFAINEVGLGPGGYISLNNFSKESASLDSLFLCQGAKCFQLPDIEVAPGATVQIAIGNGAGLENVVATDATIGELQPSGGEVALFSSKDLKDPKAILAYLEWGSSPHKDTQVAIDAGLWVQGAFAPSAENAIRVYRSPGGQWMFETR